MEKNSGDYELSNNTFSHRRTHILPSKKRKRGSTDGLKGFYTSKLLAYYYFQHLLLGGFLSLMDFLVVGVTWRSGIISKHSRKIIKSVSQWEVWRECSSRCLYDCRRSFLFRGAPGNYLISEAWRLSAIFFVNNDYQIFSTIILSNRRIRVRLCISGMYPFMCNY